VSPSRSTLMSSWQYYAYAVSHCSPYERFDIIDYRTTLYIRYSRRWTSWVMPLQLGGPGFASAEDRGRLEAFLRRSSKFGYRASSSVTFAGICADAESQLFARITSKSQHLLHQLLPPQRQRNYSLRDRSHNYQRSHRLSGLGDKKFFTRMLYSDPFH